MHHQSSISHDLDNWRFNFVTSGLSPTQQIEHIAEINKLFRSPTIIFGKNVCAITQRNKNFSLTFNARYALKYLNYEVRKQQYYGQGDNPKPNGISYMPEKLQVKHAQKWKSIGLPEQIEIEQIQESSDTFFVTSFKGLLEGDFDIQRVSECVIPVHKLGPQNQIKFYQQGSMYEDQLDDNGLIQYEYKFRSMSESWFGLIRCYVRVDEVIVLIHDTRIYWQKGWNKIGRQFMVKRGRWEQIKQKGFDFMGGGWSTNPHQSHLIYDMLDEIFVDNQYIHLK